MKKLYIKTENSKLYIVTESTEGIIMTENTVVRPAISFASGKTLTEMPTPRKGESCVFKFRGKTFHTENVSAYYYA